MNIRSLIVMNRGAKYKIDGVFYEHEMYIPEIVRDKVVLSYCNAGDIMLVKAKDKFGTIEECNDALRMRHGKNITVQIKSYVEDDDSIWYYYTSSKYGDSDAYETLEEAYENANDYLNGVGELW